MALPAYWWLLALSMCVQGAFFMRLAVLRMRGKRVQPLARPATLGLLASGVAGLAYGVVQRDPLFFAGQVCLFIIYFRVLKNNDATG